MPRNTKKFEYVTVGIPRNSPVLRHLKAEASQSGTPLSKLIPVKLADYYRGVPPSTVEPTQTIGDSATANALAFLDNEE